MTTYAHSSDQKQNQARSVFQVLANLSLRAKLFSRPGLFPPVNRREGRPHNRLDRLVPHHGDYDIPRPRPMALNLVHSPEGTCRQKHFDGTLVERIEALAEPYRTNLVRAVGQLLEQTQLVFVRPRCGKKARWINPISDLDGCRVNGRN